MFESFSKLIEMEVTDENVEHIAKKLSGSVDTLGIDSISIFHWLLKFGGASTRLSKGIDSMVEWFGNEYTPG